MRPLHFVYQCLLLVASLALVGACQRASYSFPRVEVCTPAQLSLPSSDAQALPAAALEPVPTAAPRPFSPYRRHVASAGGARLRLRTRPLATWPQPAPRLGWHRTTAPAAQPADSSPIRYRSQAIAIVLAVLSVTYLPFSLHNFYLGYYGRGALAIVLLLVGFACFAVGIGGLFFGTTTLGVLAYALGVTLLLGWAIWQVSDLIRIITGHLKPRDGEYIRKNPMPNPAEPPSR